MKTIIQDTRYAVRSFLRTPGFALAAVVTLALAIGVNTAIFSLINTIFYGPLPYPGAERFVRLHRQLPQTGDVLVYSYDDYLNFKKQDDTFEKITAAYQIPLPIRFDNVGELGAACMVAGDYFDMFDIQPDSGRLLTPQDNETMGAHSVAVLGHKYWHGTLGGQPDIIGKTITVGKHPFTIVGIAPEGFNGFSDIATPCVYVPIKMVGQVSPGMEMLVTSRQDPSIAIFGQLQPGVSIDKAEAVMKVITAQTQKLDPAVYANAKPLVLPCKGILPLFPKARQSALRVSYLIMGMVMLVLVVGCANVANLFLARSPMRQKEIGVRLAMGATTARIVRQLLTESLIIAMAGGALGLLLGHWTLHLMALNMPDLPHGLSVGFTPRIDSNVLLFVLGTSVVTGLLFGLAPALGAAQTNTSSALKLNRGSESSGPTRSRLRNSLVVAQVAVSFVLLVSSGLFVNSLVRAQSIDPGFSHDKTLALSFFLGQFGYGPQQTHELADNLVERVASLPGVESASIDCKPPLHVSMAIGKYWIEGYQNRETGEQSETICNTIVSANNFKTLNVPLLRGRDFTASDTAESQQVVIVNKAFAEKYWPGQQPLGKRISGSGAEGPFREVVGVVDTVKYFSIGESPRPIVYLPWSQDYRRVYFSLLARTKSDPMELASPIRDILRDLDPAVVPSNVTTLSNQIRMALVPAKSAAALFSMFGLLALTLAAVGMSGVISFSVSQRTHEIGVRSTLGATRGDIMRMVLRGGMVLTTVGLAIGIAASVLATRLLSALLYDVSATDTITFAIASAVLIIVSLTACYIPAHRAASVNPVVALRCD